RTGQRRCGDVCEHVDGSDERHERRARTGQQRTRTRERCSAHGEQRGRTGQRGGGTVAAVGGSGSVVVGGGARDGAGYLVVVVVRSRSAVRRAVGVGGGRVRGVRCGGVGVCPVGAWLRALTG